jgi:beta-lactamase regulating signal transducer with metallopeptidase domain
MSPLLASLLHSLWIGLLCWLAARIVLRVLPSRAVELRHATVLVATALLFSGWGGAWIIHRANEKSPEIRPKIVQYQHALITSPTSAPITTNTPDTTDIGTPHPAASTQRPPWLTERITTLNREATLQACLEFLWLLGATFGLARLVYGLHAGGSRWLSQQQAGTVPEVWLAAWSGRLEERARVLKAQLIAIEAAGAPFVVGLLTPIIVVPLASCAGVSPDLAKVALAHELAHIARRDWLVELSLRVVEAVLFFNPFVWLLAAHVREEREACCDAWACDEARMPRVEFASALAAWAHLLVSGSPSATQGLGLEQGILGRVARLLGRNSTPRTRTWRGTLGVLTVITMGLCSYGLFLHWGANALRDRERVELLDQAATPYTTPDPWLPEPARETRPERIVSGKVVTDVGLPLSGVEIRFWAGDARSESGTRTKSDGSFQSSRLLIGPVELRVRMEGYAMRKIYAEANESELRSPIVLSDGISVPISVVDDEGRPVAGARVGWTLDMFGPRKSDETYTGDDGLAWIKHLPADMPVYVNAEADGFSVGGRGALSMEELNQKTPAEIRLQTGRTVKLSVMNEENGLPAAGVRIRVNSVQPTWSPGTNPHPSWNYGGLVTDRNGETVLKYLRRDTTYGLIMNPPGDEEFEIPLVAGPKTDQLIKVPATWKVVAELKNFPEKYRASPLTLKVTQGNSTRHHAVRIGPNGSGHLDLALRGDGPVGLALDDPRLAPLTVQANSPQALGKSVVLDHATLPPEQRAGAIRRVAIKFMHDGHEFFPAGRFYIHRKESPYIWGADGFTLESGKPLFAEWADGTRLKLTASWGLIGATIDLKPDAAEKEIVIDAQRTQILVPVKPAGLVRAQVRDAEGNLLRTARLMGSTDETMFSKRRLISFSGNNPLGEWQVSEPVEFSFWGTPIWAADGLVFARGPSVSVSTRNPVADVTVSLPKTRSYEFVVTDETGRGLSGVACKLSARFLDGKKANPPFGIVDRTSEADGHVRFEAGIDFQDWGGLQLLVEAQRSGNARISAAIDVGTLKKTPVIVMKSAVKFRAQIVNRSTGKGVAGVEVQIYDGTLTRFTQSSRAVSDLDGWVEFNDLAADQKFRLGFSTPRSLSLRFIQESDITRSAWRQLTPTDTGLVIYMEQE